MATSSLSGAALQASRAALSAALADQPPSTLISAEEGLEPGEIQEVNMEAQAEGIRTVFSDPTNFNVKVSHQSDPGRLYRLSSRSIPFTRLGHFGLTLLRPRAEICPRHPSLHFHRHRFPKLLVQLQPRAGWRTSSVSSASIVSRNSGGMPNF